MDKRVVHHVFQSKGSKRLQANRVCPNSSCAGEAASSELGCMLKWPGGFVLQAGSIFFCRSSRWLRFQCQRSWGFPLLETLQPMPAFSVFTVLYRLPLHSGTRTTLLSCPTRVFCESVPQSDESVPRECPTRAFYKSVSYKSVQKCLGFCFQVRVCIRDRGLHLVLWRGCQ